LEFPRQQTAAISSLSARAELGVACWQRVVYPVAAGRDGTNGKKWQPDNIA